MLAQYEKVVLGRDDDGSFFCRRYDAPHFAAPWHFHPELELTLIEEGFGQRFVGDSVMPFAAGDLVLLGSNLPHCWLDLLPAGEGARRARILRARARSVVVQFSEGLLGKTGLAMPEFGAASTLLHERVARGLRFEGPTASSVAERVRALPDRRGLDRLLELFSLLDALARLPPPEALPLASEGFSPALNLAQAGRLERVCRHAHRHFQGTVRQTEAAALAHLSPGAFSRFFRRKTGRTFVDYLNDIRVGEACRLLIEKDALNVAEICYACGFGNLSNFNRHFRLRRGLSPREYRRRYLRTAAA